MSECCSPGVSNNRGFAGLSSGRVRPPAMQLDWTTTGSPRSSPRTARHESSTCVSSPNVVPSLVSAGCRSERLVTRANHWFTDGGLACRAPPRHFDMPRKSGVNGTNNPLLSDDLHQDVPSTGVRKYAARVTSLSGQDVQSITSKEERKASGPETAGYVSSDRRAMHVFRDPALGDSGPLNLFDDNRESAAVHGASNSRALASPRGGSTPSWAQGAAGKRCI